MGAPMFGELTERLRHGTVCILPERGSGRGRQAEGATMSAAGQPLPARDAVGSGILLSSEGLVITNAHVVRGRAGKTMNRATVELWDGRTGRAILRKIDHGRDLAALLVEPADAAEWGGDVAPLSLGDSDAIRPGEVAVAVGSPLGFRGAVSAGVFHAPASPPGPGGRSWVQASLQLAPGNSGGPLSGATGDVLGVNAMVSGGIAFAVPSRAVRAFLASSPEDPALGVAVKPLLFEDGPRHRFGLMVVDVEPGGPADEASLRKGDLVFGTEELDFRTIDDLQDCLAAQNDVVRLRFRRGARAAERVVSVRPRPRGRFGSAQRT